MKPLHRMTDAELDAIASDDGDERQDDALDELDRRADAEPPEDTPSLPLPWWITER